MPLLSTSSPGHQPLEQGPSTPPRQVRAGDPPTWPKDTATSWQHMGAILGRERPFARAGSRGACT